MHHEKYEIIMFENRPRLCLLRSPRLARQLAFSVALIVIRSSLVKKSAKPASSSSSSSSASPGRLLGTNVGLVITAGFGGDGAGAGIGAGARGGGSAAITAVGEAGPFFGPPIRLGMRSSSSAFLAEPPYAVASTALLPVAKREPCRLSNSDGRAGYIDENLIADSLSAGAGAGAGWGLTSGSLGTDTGAGTYSGTAIGFDEGAV
jgi:uncharacterized membrane protein